MRWISIADVMTLAGLALLGAGLAGVDWRLACGVCGGLMIVAGIVGAAREIVGSTGTQPRKPGK